jgi:hypothetical protein
LASTGKVVIGVFHTLFAGNAGQFVPGNVGPTTRALALLAELGRGVAPEIIGAALTISPITMSALAVIAVRRDR